MTAIRLSRLWPSLESIRGLSCVESLWRQRLDDELDRLKPFLRALDRAALEFPRPDGAVPAYRVVRHGPGDIVGVCDETGETIPLSEEHLTVHEIDRRRFCEALALGLGLERQFSAVAETRLVFQLGWLPETAGRRVPAYLALQQEIRAFHSLVGLLACDGPIVLAVPTRQLCGLTKRSDVLTLPLCDSLVLDGSGRFQATETARAAFAEFHCRVSGAACVVPVADRFVFRRRGTMWVITYEGQTLHEPDSRGLAYLGRLISQPDAEIPVADLFASVTGQSGLATNGSAGELLDRTAIAAYKARAQELQEELEEANDFHDLGRRERVAAELQALSDEVTRATGLGGRLRRRDDGERIRKSVCNAIERALARITGQHTALGRHLDASVCRGRSVAYRPPTPVPWIT
jgi:hypothetical protein